MRWAIILLSVWSSCESVLWADAPAGRYFLGAAKLEISPQAPVLLSGYAGREHRLTHQVVQPLFARAVAIGPDRQPGDPLNLGPALLIAVDNCAVHAAVRRVVCGEIAHRLGVPPESITVTSTHTHSGPMLSGALSNLLIRDLTAEENLACDRYTQQLIGQMVEVAAQALECRQWVTLQRNVGQVDFAINRRGGGVVDHELPLLVAYDDRDRPVCVLTNYACHCVAAGSGLEICGDWAGYAAHTIDAANEGLVSVILIGCGADQNPGQMGGLAAAQQQGEQLAAQVQSLLASPKQVVTGPLQTRFAEIELPLDDLPDMAQWETKSQQGGIVGYHAAKNLRRLAAGQSLPTAVTYPIQTWTFGQDLALAFLGGEVVVDYVHLLRRKIDPNRLWVTAYANDVACYIPSERILAEGGYEGGDAMVWYDLPVRFAPGVENLVVGEVTRQLGPDFAAAHDPTRTGGTRPQTPAEALQQFQTHESLVVQLVAAEPLIEDPVAIDFGPDGALWVAQMADYPAGLDGQYQPGGSIRTLRDLNGDGQYDSAVTFLSGLPFPTDVKVWRDGVLICAAPHVLFARDTTGDGRADQVRTVLEGFETHNYQARVNSLSWGLDHWVYGAAGIFGGVVRNSQGTETDLSNRDFRFSPDLGGVQAVNGRTQQGRARDDWGNWFGCDNGTLLYHYPETERGRFPTTGGPTPPTAVAVAQSNRLYPAGQTVQWALSGPPGVPTSACGMTILRSDLLGTAFAGSALTCEPVNQLVHRLTLRPRGTTFTGVRDPWESEREFLSSTDNWFRPVQVKTGLDGGLYVVDMYRYLIEHPRFLPPEVQAEVDVRAGQGMGRIYRVVPRQGAVSPPASSVDLTALSSAEVARRMETPNGTLRDLAHQVLWWRHPRDSAPTPDWEQAVSHLQRLADGSPLAAVRIQAVALLDDWDALEPAALLAVLDDPDSRVRRQALRLVERRLMAAEESPTPGSDPDRVHPDQDSGDDRLGGARGKAMSPDQLNSLGIRVAELAEDADPQVRLQAAVTLGYWDDPRSMAVLSRMWQQDVEDVWMVAAVLRSLNRQRLMEVLDPELDRQRDDQPLSDRLRELARLALAQGSPTVVQELLPRIPVPRENASMPLWQLQLWGEIAAAFQSHPDRWGTPGREAFMAQQRERWRALEAAFGSAAVDQAWRIQALRLAGGAGAPEQVLPLLTQALSPQQPVAIQEAALESLGGVAGGGNSVATAAFFATFPQLTPLLQARWLQIAQTSSHLTRQLLSELAAGRQPLTLLDPAARQVLLEHPDSAIRQAAADLFAEGTRGHWAEQFPQYRDLNPQLGSAQQGQAVFRQHCAGCHRMEDLGHAVGPDLMALTDKSSAALLQAILDPNADIDARYVAYLILTDEGQVVHGVLQSESAASLTLVGQDGKQWQVSRSRIEEIRRTDKSLMPEGLERELTPTALQDLLAYLGATATKIRYQYPVGSGPHPIYPDSTPPGKLVDGRHGTGRFDDGQWVSFSHVGRRPQQANFDLGAAQGLTEIRITYGVNHVPGVIHAPRTMQLRLKSADGSVVAAVTVDDWDDTADGLGVYQIARRHKRVTLAATTARFVELEWENDYEWSSLVEVEFNPTHEPDPPAPPPTPTADRTAGESASARIMALVATADVGSADEYRVIPEIWREALEAGKRNQTEELRGMLADVLPKMDQPLRDWQAVVIGGGIINGLSQVGLYPGPRLREILADQPEVLHRMERSLALASDMADHEPTPAGTRYDALRMVALSPWSAAQTPLQRYLQAGTNHELQQGAVSGLVDVPEPAAVGLLHAALDFLPQDLQELAVQGMASDRRRDRWKAALKSGIVPPQQLHPRLQALRGVD